MSSVQAADLFNVKGLIAVITGGGSGIGLMMTKALALNGAAKVYIVGRRKEVLDAAAKESPHGNIIPIVGDVTSKESLQSIAQKISDTDGYINVLIANSGILGPMVDKAARNKSLEEFQEALWQQDFKEYTNAFEVNCSGVFFSAVAFLGLLSKGNQKENVVQKSQIIATSSIASFNRAAPGGLAYGQSKAAVTHLMKTFATILAPHDIRSNILAPGLYPSDLAAPLLGDGKIAKDRIPLERLGDPEDMAGAILYLTSRAGAYCNGNVVVTDGGRLSLAPSTY